MSPRDGRFASLLALVALFSIALGVGHAQSIGGSKTADASIKSDREVNVTAIDRDVHLKAVLASLRQTSDGLLLRVELELLQLRIVGTSSINRETWAYIKRPGVTDTMVYRAGDLVGGFRIVQIEDEFIVLERDGIRLWQNVSGDHPPEKTLGIFDTDLDAGDDDVPNPGVEYKIASAEIKVLAEAYGSARIVEASTVISNPNGGPAFTLADTKRFIVPLHGRMTSGFGYRKNPMGGGGKVHKGVDIAAAYKSPVRAAAAGQVKSASRNWSKGKYVEISHADGFKTIYFHLAKTAVKKGQWIGQGDVIGYEGSTGISTGPHLHFEIHKDGQAIDPALFIRDLSRR